MLELDRRGLPGVMLASEAFVEGADAQAAVLNFEPAIVYTSHPIQNRTDTELESMADALFTDILDAITTN